MRNVALTIVLLLALLAPLTRPVQVHAEELANDRKPGIALSNGIGVAGTAVQLTGVGLTPNGKVQIRLGAADGMQVAEMTADELGGLRDWFTVPASATGLGGEGAVKVYAYDVSTGISSLPALFRLVTAPPFDYALPNGWFFTQTNGAALGAATSGYPVVDTHMSSNMPVRFYSEFNRLGGVAMVGYPMSSIFEMDGFYTQVFQKAVFQWRPNTGEAYFLNVFDLLHDRGFDTYLRENRSTPLPLSGSFDRDKSWDEVVAARQALLDVNPAIKAVYFSVDSPLLRFGLPTSRVTDNGDHYVVRLQRAVLQQWKEAKPWAAAGEVTIANGGAIAAEVGLFPAEVLTPLPQPVWNDHIVAYLPARDAKGRVDLPMQGDASLAESDFYYDLVSDTGLRMGLDSISVGVKRPNWGRFHSLAHFGVDREQWGILRIWQPVDTEGGINPDTLITMPVKMTDS